jgi:hypothetical protein
MADYLGVFQETAQIELSDPPFLNVFQVLMQVELAVVGPVAPGGYPDRMIMVYPSDVCPPTIYQVTQNFDFGHKVNYIDTDDRAVGMDGTSHSLIGARKKKFELHFTCTTKVQLDALTAIWALRGAVDLYLNGNDYDATVKIISPLSPESVAAFDGSGNHTYSYDLIMEEI